MKSRKENRKKEKKKGGKRKEEGPKSGNMQMRLKSAAPSLKNRSPNSFLFSISSKLNSKESDRGMALGGRRGVGRGYGVGKDWGGLSIVGWTD